MKNMHKRYHIKETMMMVLSFLMAQSVVSAPANTAATGNLGGFQIEMTGSFKQKTPTGSDEQTEAGKIVVEILELKQIGNEPSVHNLHGTGSVGWYENVTSPKCNFSASATIDIVVAGWVHPWPVCQMELQIIWKESKAYPLGSCYGFPLDPIRLSFHDFTLPQIDLPVKDGQKITFFLENGYMSTLVFRDVRLNKALGCLGAP